MEPWNNVVILLYDSLIHYSISDESMEKINIIGHIENDAFIQI